MTDRVLIDLIHLVQVHIDQVLNGIRMAVPYMGGFSLIGMGIAGMFVLHWIRISTRYGYDREWSLPARPRLRPSRLRPNVTGSDNRRTSMADEKARPKEDLLDEDQRIKDETFRVLIRPQGIPGAPGLPAIPRLPGLGRIVGFSPEQNRQWLQESQKGRRERTRYAVSQLSRSVATFNGLRQRDNWRQTLLASIDLRDKSLGHADFRGCVLLDVDLSGADLRGARFLGAVMWQVNLGGALLSADGLEQLQALANPTILGLDTVECWDTDVEEWPQAQAGAP